MKKLTALLTAALLTVTVSYAAEPTPTAPVASQNAVVLPGHKKQPAFLAQGHPFLDSTISLQDSQYVPYQLNADTIAHIDQIPDTMKQMMSHLPLGQIQKQTQGHTVTAMVYDWTYPVPKDKYEDPFYSLFAGKKESADTLKSVNQILAMADPWGNVMLRGMLESSNKNNKNPLPSDIVSFSLRNTTPAQALGHGFTLGSRLIIKADGWTLPFYLKSYVWKKGNTYYVLAALCADSEWDMLDSDMDALAEKAMGK